tara:strand:- start:1209 stop:1847 length:639 start_codon:yes stop_codon:yes gene_type:complete
MDPLAKPLEQIREKLPRLSEEEALHIAGIKPSADIVFYKTRPSEKFVWVLNRYGYLRKQPLIPKNSGTGFILTEQSVHGMFLSIYQEDTITAKDIRCIPCEDGEPCGCIKAHIAAVQKIYNQVKVSWVQVAALDDLSQFKVLTVTGNHDDKRFNTVHGFTKYLQSQLKDHRKTVVYLRVILQTKEIQYYKYWDSHPQVKKSKEQIVVLEITL